MCVAFSFVQLPEACGASIKEVLAPFSFVILSEIMRRNEKEKHGPVRSKANLYPYLPSHLLSPLGGIQKGTTESVSYTETLRGFDQKLKQSKSTHLLEVGRNVIPTENRARLSLMNMLLHDRGGKEQQENWFFTSDSRLSAVRLAEAITSKTT